MQLPHNAVLPLQLRDPRVARPIAAANPLPSVEEAGVHAPATGGPKCARSDYSASHPSMPEPMR